MNTNDLVDECEMNTGNSRLLCDTVLTVATKPRGIYCAAYWCIISVCRFNMAAEIEFQFQINANMDDGVTTEEMSMEEDTEGEWCNEVFDVEKFVRDWEEEVKKLPHVPYEPPSPAEAQEEFQNWSNTSNYVVVDD